MIKVFTISDSPNTDFYKGFLLSDLKDVTGFSASV